LNNASGFYKDPPEDKKQGGLIKVWGDMTTIGLDKQQVRELTRT
jgi:hypothetical protein